MSMIKCRDLVLGYDGKPAAENISFTVESGDYLFVIGENGSGKSTLMKALLGLHPPISGTITFGDGLRRGEIGYLPQQTNVQRDFPASVKEVVLSGCAARNGMRPFYSASLKRRAEEKLRLMGISHLADRSYRELSGGQQQRVLLARALSAADKALLLDEPVTGLDPNAAEEMYSEIKRLNREEKMTVIMVSHDIEAAERFATHILRIGRKVFFGTAEDYFNGTPASEEERK